MQKGQTLIFLLIGLIVLVAVTGGAYLLGTKNKTLSETVSEQNPVIWPSANTEPSSKPSIESLPTNSDEAANPDSTGANWKTYKENPSSEELQGFPIYPNAIFIGKQSIIPCMNGADKNGFSTCNAVVYSWKTPDDWDKVTSWYRNIGWMCGGAGTYSGPRDASGGGNNCTKNNKRFGTFFDATAEETRITFALYP